MLNIAAVLRYAAGTGWYVQSDAGHAPIGVSGVEPVTTTYGKRLRVHFEPFGYKAGSLHLQPDNDLAKAGFVAASGEVGTSAADFELVRRVNIRGFVSFYNGSVVAQYTDPAFPVTVADIGGGTVRVTHTQLSDALLVPIVCQRKGYYVPRIGDSFGSTFFDINFPVSAMDAACGAFFVRQGIDVVDPSAGYSNSDGNFFLQGGMHAVGIDPPV